MIGKIYFDETKKLDLAQAVQNAAALYRAHFGGHPEIVEISIKQYPQPPDKAGGYPVKAVLHVNPNHYYAGVEAVKE